MPTYANDLVKNQQRPVSVLLHDSLQVALELMVSNDFSQLPVVDTEDVPQGLITSDSIVRGLENFGVTVERLRVRDVMEKQKPYSFEDSIFDVLDSLKTNAAVIIVDAEGRLAGIVTNWDTAEYFRRRAEDTMFIEDIETALKQHIHAAFRDPHTQELDHEGLQEAIDEVDNAVCVKGLKQLREKH